MSLADNYDKVAFLSDFNIDKIVKVWEGSFNRQTQTSPRVGSFSTLYVHSFSHGFTRPLFLDLLFSTDNVTWVDGGAMDSGGASYLAFSDSTNVYITSGFSQPNSTIYYKVIGFWIDDYDATNPLVPEYHHGEKPILFDSRLNYQKMHSYGVLNFTAGTGGSTQTQTADHNLGYKPNAKAYFEAFSNEVWPLNAGGASNPFNYTGTQDEADMRIHDNTLDVRMYRHSNAARRAWYRIYVDA